jgi:hypothetical protein
MEANNADQFIKEIYNAAFRGYHFSSKEIIEAVENFHPEYAKARLATLYGEEARDMYQCVEKALHHFNPKWDDPNWIYFTIGGKKTCLDVLNWLKEVIDHHVAYCVEHKIAKK